MAANMPPTSVLESSLYSITFILAWFALLCLGIASDVTRPVKLSPSDIEHQAVERGLATYTFDTGRASFTWVIKGEKE